MTITRTKQTKWLRILSLVLLFTMVISAMSGRAIYAIDIDTPDISLKEPYFTTIKIIWDDYENQYGTRPESVGLTVYANGDLLRETRLMTLPDPATLPPAPPEPPAEPPAEPPMPPEPPAEPEDITYVGVSEDGSWNSTFAWSAGPLYEPGNESEFSIAIGSIPGYTTNITPMIKNPDRPMFIDFEIVCRYRRPSTPSAKPSTSPKGSISFDATKELTGMDLAADMFSFELYEGETLLQTKKNAADGTIAFDEIKYGKSDAGTHTYTMKEVAGDLEGVTYDESVYTITVTVENDGSSALKVSAEGADGIVFKNAYEAGIGGPDEPVEGDTPDKPEVTEDSAETADPADALSPYSEEPAVQKSPNTGDSRNTAIWISVSALALLGIVLLGRKREELE